MEAPTPIQAHTEGSLKVSQPCSLSRPACSSELSFRSDLPTLRPYEMALDKTAALGMKVNFGTCLLP